MSQTVSRQETSGALGAYGLEILGLDDAAAWMQPVASGAPRLRVSVATATADSSPSFVDESGADIALLGGGRLRARPGEESVRFEMPTSPTADELLHPFLSAAAALVWRWRGEEALHGGVVQIGESAVLLLGDKEAGKSTTLGWLAQEAGLAVLSDDLAVVLSGEVQAGPRTVDLRNPGSAAPGAHLVRGGERSRVRLNAVPSALPIGGTVLLRWGAQLAIDAVPPADRLGTLAVQRTFPRLPANEFALLEIASRPMVVLTRRRDANEIAASGCALIEHFAGQPG